MDGKEIRELEREIAEDYRNQRQAADASLKSLGDAHPPIDLPAIASKGKTGGGRIPISTDLRIALIKLAATSSAFDPERTLAVDLI